MINAVGAATTFVVLLVVTYTKFAKGAWLSITAMALLVPTFWAIHRHYGSVSEQLRRGAVTPGRVGANRVVLIASEIDAATAEAVGYARAIRPTDLRVLHPTPDGHLRADVREAWRRLAGTSIDLTPLRVRGGDLLAAVRAYLQGIPRGPDDFITVIVPELVRERLPFYLVRHRTLVRVKSALLREPNVVVADAPVPTSPGTGSLDVPASRRHASRTSAGRSRAGVGCSTRRSAGRIDRA